MCEPRNRDNGASDVWALTAYIYSENFSVAAAHKSARPLNRECIFVCV